MNPRYEPILLVIALWLAIAVVLVFALPAARCRCDEEDNMKMRTFKVRDFLDRPEVIESYIGDLHVQIEKLYALIQELKDQRSRSSLGYQPPGDLAHPVDP